MKKKELLNLPKLGLVKEITETAAKDKGRKEKGYPKPYRVYEYKEYYRAKVFDDVLKVAIYQREDIIRKTPSYLIFLSKEKRKFLTYDTLDKKWRTAKIDRLNGIWNYYSQKRYYCKGVEKTIVSYLDNEKKTGYEAIYNFQSSIRTNQLKRRHRRIIDEIDSKMELVPKLPKDFNRHVENKAMIHSRYIYYKYSRKVEKGYCTHCKKDVKLKNKPRYNHKGTCPKCRSQITYKTAKKAGTVTDEGYASILQKTREGFILRYYAITKTYNDYMNPTIKKRELIRKFYDKELNPTNEYEYKEFKNTRVIRWCNRENRSNYYYYSNNTIYEMGSTLYTRNLNRILKGTEYQYSAIDILAKNVHQFYPQDYITAYKHSKFLEYLVKAGLYNIVLDYLQITWAKSLNKNGHRLHDVLKIKKSQVKTLGKINPTIDQLMTLQEANKHNIHLTVKQFKTFANFHSDELLRYMHIKTPHKIIKYVIKQNKENKEELYTTARYYNDYLNMQIRLGEELENDFIFFPKDLKAAHDIAVNEINYRESLIRDMKNDERDNELRKIAKEIKHYKMKDKDFAICIPCSTKELKEEGNKLHHCVVTYADTIISRKSIILFIRETKEINKPFFTLEIKNNKVIQVRGKYNCEATPEVESFVEKFKRQKLYKQPERQAV